MAAHRFQTHRPDAVENRRWSRVRAKVAEIFVNACLNNRIGIFIVHIVRIHNFSVMFHRRIFQFFENVLFTLNVSQAFIPFSDQIEFIVFGFLHFIENFVEILAKGETVVL